MVRPAVRWFIFRRPCCLPKCLVRQEGQDMLWCYLQQLRLRKCLALRPALAVDKVHEFDERGEVLWPISGKAPVSCRSSYNFLVGYIWPHLPPFGRRWWLFWWIFQQWWLVIHFFLLVAAIKANLCVTETCLLFLGDRVTTDCVHVSVTPKALVCSATVWLAWYTTAVAAATYDIRHCQNRSNIKSNNVLPRYYSLE